jgi:FLVCR family MFS transporter 7
VSGIIAAIVTAPLFDRILTKHLGYTTKVIVPLLSLAWLSLIWDGACFTMNGVFQWTHSGILVLSLV